MSGNNNSEMNGMIFAIAIIGVSFMFMAAAFAVVLALFSAFMTGIAIWAWNQPRVFMKQIILPSEARLYVYSGFVGAMVMPILVGIAASYMKFTVSDEYLLPIIILGYSIGSNGVGMIMAQIDEANSTESEPLDVTPRYVLQHPMIEKPKQPFEYATWDDEERG